MKRNILISLALIVFLLNSCIYKSININKNQNKYYPVLGSIIRVLDNNEIKYLFVECRTKYFSDSLKNNNFKNETYNYLLADFYDFNRVYIANNFDTLLKHYECKLIDSIAPITVQQNILKDSILIYSDDYSVLSSNCIWYCRNGYLPFGCCYDGPIIYVNKRKDLRINTYHFIKDW